MICVHDNWARHTQINNYPLLHKHFYSEFSIFYGPAIKPRYEKHQNTPLTFKTTLQGEENYFFDNITMKVTPRQYLLLNHGQQYSCEVESPGEVHSLSIFFGTRVLNHAAAALKNKDEILLENIGHWNEQPFYFYEKLYNFSPPLDILRSGIVSLLDRKKNNELELESLLYQLLTELMLQHNHEKPMLDKINVRKSSTKRECYKRLCYAADYLHSNYRSNAINLDKLSQISQLSPAHLSKHFKETFHSSPYQYLKKIRLEKGCELLKSTSHTINEIVQMIGYEDPSAFIRSFKRKYTMTPEEFRMKTSDC